MTAYARAPLVALVCLILASCATHQQTVNGRLTLPKTIQPEHGVVVLKLVSVQPVSLYNAKWRTLTVENKESGLSVNLNDTAPPLSSYSLFMGTLQKGQYEIKGLTAEGLATGNDLLTAMALLAMTSDAQNLQSRLGTFTVKPGTLTNLGTVVSALSEKRGEKIKLAVLADERGRVAALLDADPDAKARMANLETRSWDVAPPADDVAKAFDIVRAHAGGISGLEATSDDRIVIGTALGMVHVRSAEGAWSSLSVGTLDRITYVRALDDGRLFAGTDTGKYFLSSPDRKMWQERTLTGADYKIVHIEPMGAAGFAIQAVSLMLPDFAAPAKVKIFLKARLEDAADAREILSIDGVPALGKAAVFYTGEQLHVFFNRSGMFRIADWYRIDPVTYEKKVEEVTYWASDVYRLRDGTLALNRMNALSLYSSLSTDNGRTWKHNQAAGQNAIRLVDRTNGFGLSSVSSGWSTDTVGLHKTKDGGKTWEHVGTTIEGKGIMPVRLVNGRLFVFTGQRLLSTADEGQTWNTEWPLAMQTTSKGTR